MAPFFGCTFGGWLYDMFLYVGTDSVINTPYIGLHRFVRPMAKKHQDAQSPV